MSIGTITSDPAIAVKFQTGKLLGTVEESFISRIKKGGNFFFSGKLLTLIRVRDLTAVVKLAKSGKGTIPVWEEEISPILRTGKICPYANRGFQCWQTTQS